MRAFPIHRLFPLCSLLLFIFARPATAQFTDINAGLTGIGDASVGWADYDVDGDLDLIIAGESANGPVTKLYGNAGGTFTEIANTPFIGISLGEVRWGDYDNDNDPDLLLTGQRADGSPTTQLYRNDDGKFVDVNAGITALKAGMADWVDYDGDGDLDVFISGVGVDDITISRIFKNNDGSFTSHNPGIKGLRRGDSEWFDVDHDGDQDLVISGRDTQNQRWTLYYKNNKGVLTETSTSLPQIDLSSLALGNASFHQNSYLFMTGTTGSGQLSRVFYGPESFTSQSDDFVQLSTDIEGLEFTSATWGDYDNDRNAEILLMGRNQNGLVLTLIYSFGDFKDVNAGLMGLYKGDAAWGDYDNDGAPDLLLAGYDSQDNPHTLIYRNTTGAVSNGITPPLNLWTQQLGTETQLSWAEALSNVETDKLYFNVRVGTTPGGSQIVSPQALASGKSLLPHNGNAGYGRTLNLQNLPPGTYYWSVQATDFAYKNSAFAPEQIFTIKSSKSFVDTGISLKADGPFAQWADLDNDGDLDVITRSDFYINNQGSFTPMNSGVKYAREVSDIDNDGDLDVLAFFEDTDEVTLYENNNGQFTELPYQFENFFIGPFVDKNHVRFGDFDNDGDEDLLIIADDNAFYSTGSTSLYVNQDGQFGPMYEVRGPTFSIGAPAVADYDNDGDLDYFHTGLENDSYKHHVSDFVENTGGTFEIVSGPNLPSAIGGISTWVDYDNDGDLDLTTSGVIDNFESTVVKGEHTNLFRNTNASFELVTDIRSFVRGHTAWGDADNDGDSDMLLTGHPSYVDGIERSSPLYENKSGTFAHVASDFSGLLPQQGAWGDYDGDGDLDVLLAVYVSEDNYTARIFKNNGSANTSPSAPQNLTVDVDDGAILFKWQAGTDSKTPAAAFSYNLRIGTTPGGSEVMAAPALSDGTLMVPRLGNVNQNTSWPIRGLQDGTYYWSVQAIDAGLKGSAFATEQVLVLPDPTIPVELATFEAIGRNNKVTLSWETASEINNAGFVIQRAIDNGAFERIAFVEGQGATTDAHSYHFEDQPLPFGAEQLHYRLKQIDFDGAFDYSPVVSIEMASPEAIALLPNYPNPFNPSTQIRYELPVTGTVRLAVYDLTGKEVALLIDQIQEAGQHQVIFDGGGLASGVYVYRLSTENLVITRHMILVK